MKTKSVTLITCLLATLLWGCGSTTSTGGTSRTGGDSGGGTGVSVSTRVQDSTPATTSLSAGASASKGLSVSKGSASSLDESGDSEIIVAKATVDSGTSAEVKCTKLDGTVLATGTSNSSTGDVTLTIPAGEKQVILIAKLPDGGEVSNVVNVEGKVAGDKVDAGETDPETDFIFKQIFKEASFDNASLAAKFAAGTLNPLAMYKTIKEMLNESGVTAGSDTVGASMIAMAKAWREGFANNKDPGFFKNALSGDESVLAKMGEFIGGGIDLKTAMKEHLTSFIPACAKTFDETTFKKIDASGSGGYDSIAKSWITYKKGDMENIIKNPDNFRGLCQNSADKFVAGDTGAFNFFKNSKGAALISGLVGNFDPSVFKGDYEAMQKLLQNYKFGDITSAAAVDTHWKAIGNFFTSTDNPAEQASILKDPSSFANTLFNKPDVYAASGGATTAQHIFTIQGNTGGTTGDFTEFTPCSASFPCASGSTCNSLGQCVPSAGGAGACTSLCPIGTACSGSICGTGLSCTGGFCVVTAGTTQKLHGETCANTAECLPPLTCILHDVKRCSY